MTDTVTSGGDPIDPEKAAEVEKLTKAFMFALLTGNEQPYPIPTPAVRNMADRLYDCGVRQTDAVAEEVVLPNWVTEKVREEAAPVATDPDHHAMQDTDRVMVAPEPPRRIAQKYMGVVEDVEL
ncbi:hypothetical protein [Williamsia serinedens]|uniref:Uncharacterized protein n=1 Tax=Williamsia serinedens TaxID=391736 RepID=A0ABT1H9R4_9NOCA|nr:hypothetical protein [Williamsia serinedens]MCP2162652.1 hypothetical protein [Williamsia serinedens]